MAKRRKDDISRAVAGLRPGARVKVRDYGTVAPTVVEVMPDGSLEVWFEMEGDGPTTTKAAGAKGGSKAGRAQRDSAAQWQGRALARARTAIAEDPYVTNTKLAGIVTTDCKPCPGVKTVYEFICEARTDGRLPPRLYRRKKLPR